MILFLSVGGPDGPIINFDSVKYETQRTKRIACAKPSTPKENVGLHSFIGAIHVYRQTKCRQRRVRQLDPHHATTLFQIGGGSISQRQEIVAISVLADFATEVWPIPHLYVWSETSCWRQRAQPVSA